MRKLASVQVISKLSPIPDADKIEVAEMDGLGWQIVVKKGEFKLGEPVVYVEIDSQLPDKPEFDFLRKDKFRIKTRKMRGQVSQGICFPMSILPPHPQYCTGDDVTEILGVTNYKDAEEVKDSISPKKTSKVLDLLFKYTITRPIAKLITSLTKVKKEPWPSFIVKTDEKRIQNDPHFFDKVNFYYATEKLDGQSCTFFLKKKLFGYEFGVCSRNLWLKTKHKCNWWDMAEKYDMEKRLKELGIEMYVQGEICGPSVHGNKYGFKEKKFFIFNCFLLKEQRFLTYYEMASLAGKLGCDVVPLVPIMAKVKTVEEAVEWSQGESIFNGTMPREGIVVRYLALNTKRSVKVINPEFLLRYKE